MASRIGGGPPSSVPPAPSTPDNRLERMREQQLKELLEQQVVRTRTDGEHVLTDVVRTLRRGNGGEPGSQGLRNTPITPDARKPDDRRADQRIQQPPSGAPAAQPPSARDVQDLPRLVADFQRQQGLPVTGRLDPGTVNALKDKGLVIPQPAPASGAPGARDARDAGSSRAPKEDVTATRLTRAAADQQAKKRVDQPPTSSRERTRDVAREGREVGARDARDVGARESAPVDRALDPTRLLASLVLAGFAGKGKAALDEALKSFQAAQGLPVTGKLDAQTQEALQKEGHVEHQDAPSKPVASDKPVEARQQVRRALAETAPTTKNAADKDVVKDPLRPQASTNQQTTTADVAARAPVTSLDAAQQAADKARLDTVLAQQAASERGVQEGKGDPKVAQGHGEVAGEGAGHKGAGGVSGGGAPDSSAASGAIGASGGPEGDETAVGNAEAGDDDFGDEERGNANTDGQADEGAEGEAGEYWKVPPLSEQVRDALEKIARDDDGAGPVTYTWDVTFLRPGTYASGQPAEELWHVAVNHATAFDPVWQKAADAISSRMLYGEPDADPPTIDDFILALRRARVR